MAVCACNINVASLRRGTGTVPVTSRAPLNRRSKVGNVVYTIALGISVEIAKVPNSFDSKVIFVIKRSI